LLRLDRGTGWNAKPSAMPDELGAAAHGAPPGQRRSDGSGAYPHGAATAAPPPPPPPATTPTRYTLVLPTGWQRQLSLPVTREAVTAPADGKRSLNPTPIAFRSEEHTSELQSLT